MTVKFARPWRGYAEGDEVEGLNPSTEARLVEIGSAEWVDAPAPEKDLDILTVDPDEGSDPPAVVPDPDGPVGDVSPTVADSGASSDDEDAPVVLGSGSKRKATRK
jgi:hypothetical protein